MNGATMNDLMNRVTELVAGPKRLNLYIDPDAAELVCKIAIGMSSRYGYHPTEAVRLAVRRVNGR